MGLLWTELFLSKIVKRVFFYTTIGEFNQSMLQTFHEEPKESYILVENRHTMSPLRVLIDC